MKIVGCVNGQKEAEDIEEIVKVFVIKQRVTNLLSNDIIGKTNTQNMSLQSNKENNIIKPDVKNDNVDNVKINYIIKPIFNVRGIN